VVIPVLVLVLKLNFRVLVNMIFEPQDEFTALGLGPSILICLV